MRGVTTVREQQPTAADRQWFSAAPSNTTRCSFCARAWPHGCAALLSEPRTCAKTNARLTAGVPSAFKHPRRVGVDDANPRCSAQSRLGGRAP
ncbi:hypothetical protein IG631_02830 [Alternaria alternata]|nr:hypothetical protein IG631_02830 [Alternaria alternata]